MGKPMTGRALTLHYMPARPTWWLQISEVRKREGRLAETTWPINELEPGDVYVANASARSSKGTLIGSNLGSGIAAHSWTGFVFDAGIRDVEENKEVPNMNGFYRQGDPSAWRDMTLTSINAPIRIDRVAVLPGDLVIAKTDGINFAPASLAAGAIMNAEFTNREDAFNFQLNASA